MVVSGLDCQLEGAASSGDGDAPFSCATPKKFTTASTVE
jgi:hypothetical protein